MPNTALLLLDLQRDFLEAGGRLTVGERHAAPVIESANRLLKHAAGADWKLIFVKNEFRKDDWLGNFFRNRAAIAGAAGAAIDPRVNLPPTAHVVSKSESDAFSNPALLEHLTAASTDRIVVLGVMTEACVCATVQGAITRGFQVTVVSDGVASCRESQKQRGLERMRKAGASIRPCAEILAAG